MNKTTKIAIACAVAAVLIMATLFLPGYFRSRSQQAAIDRIETLGGWVEQEYSGPRRIPLLHHLRRIGIGNDVYLVKFKGRNFGNDELELLKAFPKLEQLWIDSTCITDEGFRNVQWPASLKEIKLTNTAVTSECLQELRQKRPRVDLETGIEEQDNKADAGDA